MIGRKKPSQQSPSDFRASVKSYYEDQLRRKRSSNVSQTSSRHNNSSNDQDLSLSRSELREIEQNTVHDLLSRLSIRNHQKSSPKLNTSLSPIQPTSTKPSPIITSPLSSIQKQSTPNSSAPIVRSIHFGEINALKPSKQQSSSSEENEKFSFKLFKPNEPTANNASTESTVTSNIFTPTQSNVQAKSTTTIQPIFFAPTEPLSQNLNTSTPQSSSFALNVQPKSTITIQPQLPTVSPTVSEQKDALRSVNTGVLSTESSSNPVVNEKQSTLIRQRRPSKSETPEASKFSHWIKITLESFDNYTTKLKEFKSNTAILPICNRVRMAIQETIDVYTSENDPNDIKSISAALIFFEDLYTTGAATKGDQPLPLTQGGRLFITMCICERYLKRVVGQDACIPFVATLFIVLTKKEPEMFNVLLSMIIHKCVLARLNTRQCLEQILKISNGPAEESAQWISEEYARFKLLIQICALTTAKNPEILRGVNLIHWLLSEALRAPAIPVSTPFVINTIFSINLSTYQKRFSDEFIEFVNKSKAITQLDWPAIIRQTLDADAPDMPFTGRAQTLMTAKNAVLIQTLKATLSLTSS